ncbi:hypothetical protein EMIT0158MI4_330003 [Burkholderia ambifaria]
MQLSKTNFIHAERFHRANLSPVFGRILVLSTGVHLSSLALSLMCQLIYRCKCGGGCQPTAELPQYECQVIFVINFGVAQSEKIVFDVNAILQNKYENSVDW